MRMLCAGRQLRLVEAGKIEQGAINVALGGLHILTSTASLLPPGIERGLTFRRRAIGFIRHDDICRGELVAEIVVIDRFFIQQLAGVEQAKRRTQLKPRLVDRGGQ